MTINVLVKVVSPILEYVIWRVTSPLMGSCSYVNDTYSMFTKLSLVKLELINENDASATTAIVVTTAIIIMNFFCFRIGYSGTGFLIGSSGRKGVNLW